MPPLALLLLACQGENEIKALKPNILVSPEVLDFGPVVEDYPSTLTAELINGGKGVLEIDGVTLSGDGAAAFVVSDVPAEIPHDQSWPIQVTFTPTNPTSYTAVLNVASNDPDTPDIAITLTGQGTEAPTPDVECTPLTVDYGTVAPGALGTLWATCTNVGDDDLHIASWTQGGSGAFELMIDPTDYVLPPDQSLQLIVLYAPTTDAGDNGWIELTTNDPDEPTTRVNLLGNGGGDFEYPVAIIEGPTTSDPRETITLEGGSSYDPGGYEPLTYHWTVTGPYPSITATESGSDLYLQLDLAGTYRVALQVENTQGVLSPPDVHNVEVVPVDDLHVELIWDDLADIDLHLLTSEGEFFNDPYDTNYCNPNPDWGTAGDSTDDPMLDLDAYSSPPGIENINIQSPVEDNYQVKVHYYESNGAGDVAVTVNVYLYGALEESFSRVLSRNKVWDVAEILMPEAYVVEESTELYTPTLRTCVAE